jgi:hypothetical protein
MLFLVVDNVKLKHNTICNIYYIYKDNIKLIL